MKNIMKCPRCQSESTHKNGKSRAGKQKYKCTECGYNYEDGVTPRETVKPKVGMSLDEFRDKHDVEFIINKTLDKLDPGVIYEKADLVKLSGLPYSAPGLTTILDSKTKYYGKISSKIYYSHPDTIKMLKDQAKLN